MNIQKNPLYKGCPHIRDLIISVFLRFAIGLPLTVRAVVRAIWLRYWITNHQIYVTDGWMRYVHTDIVYDEIVKMLKIPRETIELWDDIVSEVKIVWS